MESMYGIAPSDRMRSLCSKLHLAVRMEFIATQHVPKATMN